MFVWLKFVPHSGNDFIALKVLNNNHSGAVNNMPPTCHKWDILGNLAFDTPPFHRRCGKFCPVKRLGHAADSVCILDQI